ncbi:MAG: hypothetical protein ACHQII_05440 [Bacteroidia bacterium]
MAKTALRLEREKQRAIRSQIIITDITKCYVCKSTGLTANDKFCPNCGFPQQGTKDEMKRFIYIINNKKQILEDHRKKINSARNVLYVLAGLNVFVAVILGIVVQNNIPVLISCGISAAIYLALGLWSKKNPFAAILSGFFVYITLQAIAAISNPASILQGLFLKAGIISAFVYGYKAVKDSKVLEEELQSVQKARKLNIESVDIDEANSQN